MQKGSRTEVALILGTFLKNKPVRLYNTKCQNNDVNIMESISTVAHLHTC